MKFSSNHILLSWLPQLNSQVWVLAIGRFLSQTGSGFTLFYAPIFFVNQVGLSATAVGIGHGTGSLVGIFGRFLGGSLADSKRWGRRRTLLLSTVFCALASFVLALSNNFPMFLAAHLLMGLGTGLYWPTVEAAIADLTTNEQRNEAFAVTRLADSAGLGIGVLLGGVLISTTELYPALFVIDGISYLVFFMIVYAGLTETRHFDEQHSQPVLQGWGDALSDRLLLVYVSVNILFTTYIAQVDNTMPLYFANFVLGKTLKGLSPTTISGLFAWYIFLVALCQLPAVRALNSLSRVRALMISIVFWGAGFLLVWSAGVTTHGQQILAIFALSVIAIAHVTYSPFATAFVAEIAPESLRGIYLAINAQCWGVGFFVGSFLGGLALDNQKVASHTMTSGFTANNLWLAAAASTLVGFVILKTLDWMCDRQETTLI